MSKVFSFGILLAGLGLFVVGCNEPMATPSTDTTVDSPAYEQEMNDVTEAPMDTVEEGAVETTEEVPAEATPAEEAPAVEAPAVEDAPAVEAPEVEAPAVEETAPEATDAP